MWLLNARTYRLEAFEGSSIPRYAILSHRWEEDEVLFADVSECRHETRKGWAKIKSCCRKALGDDLNYIWADTCCIDKTSSAELSEAINSMFRWYKKAIICYAYLCDVTDPSIFTESVWFTRGWTLQELLAPERLNFFNEDWKYIGLKSDDWVLQSLIEKTGIPGKFLQHFHPASYIDHASIAQRMSWAAHRQTTRTEDRAYSLMGLFDVNMPLLYGEGDKAFYRLQEEIMKSSRDISILAWPSRYDFDYSLSILAASPDDFAGCNHYEAVLRRYSATKHEVVVDTRLYLQSSGLCAMLVARRLSPSGDRDLIFVLLEKDCDRPTIDSYRRADLHYNHNHLLFLKDTPYIGEPPDEKRIEISRDMESKSTPILRRGIKL